MLMDAFPTGNRSKMSEDDLNVEGQAPGHVASLIFGSSGSEQKLQRSSYVMIE